MIDYQLANNMAVFVLGFFIAGATGGLSVSGGAVLVPLITPPPHPPKNACIHIIAAKVDVFFSVNSHLFLSW